MAEIKGQITIDGKEYTYSPILIKDDGNFSGSVEPGYRMWDVFREEITWQYLTSWYSQWQLPAPKYIAYDYKKPVAKQGVVIYIDDFNIPASYPMDFTIEYMFNGEWKAAKSVTNASWVHRTPNIYWFDNPCVSSQYRIYVTKYHGGAASIHRLRFLDADSCQLYINLSKEVYGMSSSVFGKLADDWTVLTAVEKKALFEATNYETASADDLAALGKFKVISYTETENTPEIKLKVVPNDQLVFPRGLRCIESYDSIDQIALTKTLSSNGICKLIVTDDMKTYHTFDFDANEWNVVDHTNLAAVKANGIDAAALQNIDPAAWDKLLRGKSGIGFAYLMGIDAITDQCAIDQLSLQANMKGTWK